MVLNEQLTICQNNESTLRKYQITNDSKKHDLIKKIAKQNQILRAEKDQIADDNKKLLEENITIAKNYKKLKQDYKALRIKNNTLMTRLLNNNKTITSWRIN